TDQLLNSFVMLRCRRETILVIGHNPSPTSGGINMVGHWAARSLETGPSSLPAMKAYANDFPRPAREQYRTTPFGKERRRFSSPFLHIYRWRLRRSLILTAPRTPLSDSYR